MAASSAWAEPLLLQYAGGQWALTPSAPHPPGLIVIGTPEMPPDPELALLFAAAAC